MENKKANGKRLLNVEETARYLGMSPRSIYNQCCRSAKRPFPIPCKRVGGLLRFDIKDIDNFIDSL